MIANIWRKPVIIGVLAVLVLTLVVAMAVPALTALAASPTPPTGGPGTWQGLRGKVTSIAADKSSFVIQSDNQTPVTIKVAGDTKFFKTTAPAGGIGRGRMPFMGRMMGGFMARFMPGNWFGRGQGGQQATVNDIAVGDGIVARVTGTDNTASVVDIIKPSTIKTVLGTVKVISGNSITITTDNGTQPEVTLNLTGDTNYGIHGTQTIQAGQTVVAVYDSTNNNAIQIRVNFPKPTPRVLPQRPNAPRQSPGNTASPTRI